MDSHHLLLAGLPAHPIPVVRRPPARTRPLVSSPLCRAYRALAEPIGRLLDLGAASWAADRFSRLGALDPDYPRYEAAREFHLPGARYPASFRMSCGHWHRRYSRLVRPPTRRSRRPNTLPRDRLDVGLGPRAGQCSTILGTGQK